jgi:hypothetical protein
MYENGVCRVFVAGPMSSSGEPGPNLHQAAQTAASLLRLGFAPYVPHVTWVLDAISPSSIDDWKRSNFAWLSVSAALIRLPGESKGADVEVRYAEERGIPVFSSVPELVRWYRHEGCP